MRPFAALGLGLSLALVACHPNSNSSTRATPASGALAASQPAPKQADQGARGAGAFGSFRRVILVQAVQAHFGPLIAEHQAAGTVVPSITSQVSSQEPGTVAQVLVRVGDFVQSGAPVVLLDTSALQLAVRNAQLALQNAEISLQVGEQNVLLAHPQLSQQLAAAQAALAAAQRNYASDEVQYRLGGITAVELQNALSQLHQAQAAYAQAQSSLLQNERAQQESIAQLKIAVAQARTQLAQAELNLANATIRAPFSGQIATLNVEPGEFVGTGTPVFTLTSTSPQVDFSVPPSDAVQLQPGTLLRFSLPGTSYPIRISQTPAAPINGLVPLVAVFTSQAPHGFGEVGQVTYRVTLARGVQVPIAALANNGNTTFVYTIEKGKAVLHNVTIVAESGTTAVIQGIPAKAEVILNPPPGLLPGSPVQVVSPNTPNPPFSARPGGPS